MRPSSRRPPRRSRAASTGRSGSGTWRAARSSIASSATPREVTWVAASPDGRRLLSSDYNGHELRLWDRRGPQADPSDRLGRHGANARVVQPGRPARGLVRHRWGRAAVRIDAPRRGRPAHSTVATGHPMEDTRTRSQDVGQRWTSRPGRVVGWVGRRRAAWGPRKTARDPSQDIPTTRRKRGTPMSMTDDQDMLIP